MTFEKKFVLQKMDELSGYIKEIDDFFQYSENEIISDSEKLHAAERLLQLAVDTMIDVNQHFIKELNLKISEDFQGTFYILGENKILPEDFARKIAPAVGLRNRVVHRYETLDKKLFISTFRKNYPDFQTYLKIVYDYVKKS